MLIFVIFVAKISAKIVLKTFLIAKLDMKLTVVNGVMKEGTMMLKEIPHNDSEYEMEWQKIVICEEICRVMQKKGIDNRELAKRLNLKIGSITRMFRGNINFSLEKLIKIAIALDVRLNVNFKNESE